MNVEQIEQSITSNSPDSSMNTCAPGCVNKPHKNRIMKRIFVMVGIKVLHDASRAAGPGDVLHDTSPREATRRSRGARDVSPLESDGDT